MPVQLAPALVVGPIARLELSSVDGTKCAENSGSDPVIEARLPAEQFRAMGIKEGETLVVTPRRARVFLDSDAGIWFAGPPEGERRRKMTRNILNWFETAPRGVLALVAAACVALLAFGLYLQHGVGLEPCPMCIVQRYALALVAAVAAVAAIVRRRGAHLAGAGLVLLFSGFGAFVAARQSWLQWYPPEIASCGRDFYGMIETFPLRRAIPMIFRGSGDCTAVDWTFLGGSIANWSFLWFVFFALVGAVLLAKQWKKRDRHSPGAPVAA